MKIAPGTKIAHYEIRSILGAGGMGEVYLAQDLKLDRQIALKILPSDVASNRDRMDRFVREAKSAARLNHAHIAQIHEIGEHQGTHFIVMEFIDGVTLREKIHGDRPELHKLLKYLQQVAEGLAKAHTAGIVHRDLKPDNIMITRDGVAKVLDFGLAKLVEAAGPGPGPSRASLAPTEAPLRHSTPGMLMGTVGYMSPEQAQGKTDEIDQRSDIFSFGCILFEAITGTRPFERESDIKSLHDLIYGPPPPIKELNPEAPGELHRIVRRCLAKDPEERYQTIKDVALDLKELRHQLVEAGDVDHAPSAPSGSKKPMGAPPEGPKEDESASGRTGSFASRSSVGNIVSEIQRHRLLMAGGLALLVLAMAALGFGLFVLLGGRRASQPETAVMKTAPFTSFPGIKGQPAFSPDGRQIAFVWDSGKEDNPDIYVKLVGEGSPLRLTTDPHEDRSPSWSPDGRSVAFIRQLEGSRALLSVPALGGVERKLFASPGLGSFEWSPDGTHLVITDSEALGGLGSIYLLSPDTGEKKRLAPVPALFNDDRGPRFSPDGKWVAFIRSPGFAVEDIYIVPVAGGETRRLTTDGHEIAGIAWAADGRSIIFSSNRGGSNALWRVSLDGRVPEALAGAGDSAYQPAVSRQGNYLAYVYSRSDTNIWRAPGPSAPDRGGPPTQLIASTRQEGSPRYSPDGRRIAFASDRTGGIEVWVCDAEGQNQVQLTKFGGHSGTPRWSPDGNEIAFDARPEGSSDIYVVSADGGSPRRMTREASSDIMPVWSKDARWIYFGSDRSREWQIWKMPAAGGPAEQVTKGGGYGGLETDSRYVYYSRQSGGVASNKANRPGVWRVPLTGGDEEQVFDQGAAGAVAVTPEGIGFYTRALAPNPLINFYHFATRQVTTLLSIERSKSGGFAGRLSISPDGRWVVYVQTDQTDNDIMLVENFR